MAASDPPHLFPGGLGGDLSPAMPNSMGTSRGCGDPSDRNGSERQGKHYCCAESEPASPAVRTYGVHTNPFGTPARLAVGFGLEGCPAIAASPQGAARCDAGVGSPTPAHGPLCTVRAHRPAGRTRRFPIGAANGLLSADVSNTQVADTAELLDHRSRGRWCRSLRCCSRSPSSRCAL
jgi:hypothetical protein